MNFKLIMVFVDIDKTDKLLDVARDAGATGYLSKPVSIGPFMAAVKGLVPGQGPAPAA